MKKFSLILFSGLFAIIMVFVQCTDKQQNAAGGNVASTGTSVSSSDFAYFLIDSVMSNFTMALDKSTELQSKQTEYETKLTSEQSKLEKNVQDYSDKVNKGLVTRATASDMEQSLNLQQQNLQNLSYQYQEELAEAQTVAYNQVIDYIETFLKENRSTYNYRYIFAKSFGGQLFYADEADDVTNQLLRDLNAKYASEKK
ncbi:MAG: OmpH family outer membrane protein [Bacteroidales bacterium]|nr:OmpH family outer membrane protein [Bacteroidales bacterium]